MQYAVREYFVLLLNYLRARGVSPLSAFLPGEIGSRQLTAEPNIKA